jgi:hypothetical protein
MDPDGQLNKRPSMVGVQCFEVPLTGDAGVLLLHLRDVGLIFPPEQARPAGAAAQSWQDVPVDGRKRREVGGIEGGLTRTSSELGASLAFGANRLTGNYDLTLEGAFGAGVNVLTDVPLPPGSTDVEASDPLLVGTLRESANGFGAIQRNRALNGTVLVENSAGTDVAIGRLFARPRDLPPSCDMPIALSAGERRELHIESAQIGGGAPLRRPGLTVAVVSITGASDARVARIAVGSYLSRRGVVRHTMLDWTQQFEGPITVEACDGTRYREPGPTGVPRGQAVIDADLRAMLAQRADEITAEAGPEAGPAAEQ